MHDYPPEYDQENLDNTYLAEAFPNADSPAELYRQVYRWTSCGAYLSVRINYYETLPADGSGYDADVERSKWVHSDGLKTLGTWKNLDEQGILITALMVGSIVEGVDYGTDDIELEIDQLDEEPEAFNKRFYAAIDEVESQALAIWNDTHGCDHCAEHWADDSGITKERLHESWDSIPVWKECPDCQGHGTII